ncbi:MAG TPA: hypothetical protein VNP72_09320 [Longimicrobium sp.]|nr:hypothetical protein [Longimicrobium sp.]
MTANEHSFGRGEWPALALCVLWVGSYFGARMVLEMEGLGTALRVAVALVPLLPFAALLWMVIAGLRSMDELERRIQLEALAVAYPLAILLLMLLGLLQLAVDLSPDDWSYRHLWPFLFVFYFLGVARARARYT